MNRAFHYAAAERLAEEAVRVTKDAAQQQHQSVKQAARNDAHLFLRAALIHATLATANPEVEAAAIARAADPARPVPGPHLHEATRGERR